MDIYTIMSLKEQLDDLDKKRIRLYNNIKKYCESLDPEYLKTLDYTELKEFFHTLEFYLPESVQMVYRRIREEKYPELKKAVYYPELNQIDFLSLKKIKTIDTLLGTKWKKGDFIYNPFYSAADLNREEQEKFNDYAVAKRIFIKKYRFRCKCGKCFGRLFSEDAFNNMKRYYESGIDTTGSDEVDSYFYIECEYDSDCDLEICDKKSFERAKYDVCYIKSKEPNTEHEQY